MSDDDNTPEGIDAFFAALNAPREPSAELKTSAAKVHEIFRSFVDAGFSEPQAMQLVIAAMTQGGKQ